MVRPPQRDDDDDDKIIKPNNNSVHQQIISEQQHEDSYYFDNKSMMQSESSTTTTNTDTTNTSVRNILGDGMMQISNVINDNIIIARYTAIVTIGILSVYGITHTPLFFRYRNIHDIPKEYYIKRKFITGRVMKCNNNNNNKSNNNKSNNNSKNNNIITCYIRHLSPIERILPKSIFNTMLAYHPAATFLRKNNTKPEENETELIQIQIAGIEHPQLATTTSTNDENKSNNTGMLKSGMISLPNMYNEDLTSKSKESVTPANEFIQKLVKEQKLVRCQLLGRKVLKVNNNNGTTITKRIDDFQKRPIPQDMLEQQQQQQHSENDNNKEKETEKRPIAAIAKVYYRPKITQLFATDIGEYLTQQGKAIVSSDGIYIHSIDNNSNNNISVDNTTDQYIRKDIDYITKLENAEYTACNKYYGIWSNEIYRKYRNDIVTEIEFQNNATILQKLYRWFKER